MDWFYVINRSYTSATHYFSYITFIIHWISTIFPLSISGARIRLRLESCAMCVGDLSVMRSPFWMLVGCDFSIKLSSLPAPDIPCWDTFIQSTVKIFVIFNTQKHDTVLVKCALKGKTTKPLSGNCPETSFPWKMML